MSLREEIAGPDPDFQMELPPGWVRMNADEQARDEIMGKARSTLMKAHRPDLWAQARVTIDNAFAQLMRVHGIAVMLPMEPMADGTFLPASLTASVQTARPGEKLDDFIAALITRGATALDGDRRFVRYERRSEERQHGESIGLTTVQYLTPIPGSARQRALVLTAGMPHPVDVSDDDPLLSATRAIIDVHVATLRWVSPQGQQ